MGALLFYQSTYRGSPGCCLQQLWQGAIPWCDPQWSNAWQSFVWSLHGASWSWRGHQETFCEVTQYLLLDTGISGPLKFLLVQSHMKSLLPNKKRISNQNREGIKKAKAEEDVTEEAFVHCHSNGTKSLSRISTSSLRTDNNLKFFIFLCSQMEVLQPLYALPC